MYNTSLLIACLLGWGLQHNMQTSDAGAHEHRRARHLARRRLAGAERAPRQDGLRVRRLGQRGAARVAPLGEDAV